MATFIQTTANSFTSKTSSNTTATTATITDDMAEELKTKLQSKEDKTEEDCLEKETEKEEQSETSVESSIHSIKEQDNNVLIEQDSNTVPFEIYRKLLEERDQLLLYKQQEMSFQDIAKRLETKCLSQQDEVDKMEEMLKEEKQKGDTAQRELNEKLAELTQAIKNEEAVMARLASLDQERMKLLDEQVNLERKNKEFTKEQEKSQSIIKSQKTELSKLKTTTEKQETTLSEQTKEISKLKEEISSLNIKLKWAQNKLKTESEGHKEVKAQLSVSNKKLQEAKEESIQIRSDLKKMIAQYQESEEMKSNSLDVKLRQTEEELKIQEQEIVDQQQLLELTVKDLELNQASLELTQKECQQLKSKVSELTKQITEKQDQLDKMKQDNIKEKKEQKRLLSEIEAIQDMNKDIEKERQDHAALRESHNQLQKTIQHLERELGRRKDKESELLTFSEKLSSSNAELTTEKNSLDSQLLVLKEEMTLLRTSLNTANEKIKELGSTLQTHTQSSQKEITSLMQSLQDKSKAVEQLSISLEEEREQIIALKRKHSNNIKDMQRQVQLYSKRIEQLESTSDVATLPLSSQGDPNRIRSISQGSLDGGRGSYNNLHLHASFSGGNRIPSPDENLGSPPITQVRYHSSSPSHTSTANNSSSSNSQPFQTLDREKTVLVEKLCQLKRQLAKKDEKIEFFEGHCQQLTEDIKGKARLIQHFIMREEAGALIPASADANKAQLSSRKSTIMSSVFSGGANHSQSGAGRSSGSHDMSLDLSLEINRKMQAVLEDTILKNITLKESIDTLGQEVARLSSQLQNLQQKSCNSTTPLR